MCVCISMYISRFILNTPEQIEENLQGLRRCVTGFSCFACFSCFSCKVKFGSSCFRERPNSYNVGFLCFRQRFTLIEVWLPVFSRKIKYTSFGFSCFREEPNLCEFGWRPVFSCMKLACGENTRSQNCMSLVFPENMRNKTLCEFSLTRKHEKVNSEFGLTRKHEETIQPRTT